MITHHPPTLAYKGLTIILDKPSRFDVKGLISGNAGDNFDKYLAPFTRYNCDIRLANSTEPLLPDTRVILLLGQEALDKFKPGASLLTYRGSPLIHPDGDKILIPTISPQEANDRKNYENPEDDEGGEEKESEKDYQKTSRKNFKFWLGADVRKSVRLCREGLSIYPKVTFNYCPESSSIINKLHNFNSGYIVVDIETDSAQNLTVFSLLFSETATLDPNKIYEVFVLPFKRYTGVLHYSNLDYCKIFTSLTRAFSRNTVVGHNLSFDTFILHYKYHIALPLSTYDTMVAHHRCHPEIEKSLGHCTSYYTDLPYHKDEGVFEPKTDQQETQLWTYNAKDVWTTFLVFVAQQAEIKRLKAEASVIQGCASVRSLLKMQAEGCLGDIELLRSIVSKATRKLNQYKRILKLLTKRELNPRSADDISHYLYDILKLQIPASKKKKGADSTEESLTKYGTKKGPTSEEVLLKLYIKHPIPSIRIILAARGEGKEASSLRKLRLWKGDRLTCQYKVTGTNTFRIASTGLLAFKGNKKKGVKKVIPFGTNMTNWNKRIRPIIIAPPGYIIFQIDQAGAEALVVAYLCKMGRFRSLFINKIKPHTFVAMHIAAPYWAEKLNVPNIDDYLNSPIADLKKLPLWPHLSKLITESDNESNPQKRFYYIGKTMCHLLNYDAQWQQFQLSALIKSEGALAFTDAQAKYYRELYRSKLFPEITDFHGDVQRELVAQNKILRNLFGHPRIFNAPFDRELFKEAYAFKPQSTVGVITLTAQTEITQRIDSREELVKDVKLWQNGHDSIMGICPEANWKEIVKSLIPHMERELINDRLEKFKMGSGTSIGYNWGGYDEIKNPKGLREFDWSKEEFK